LTTADLEHLFANQVETFDQIFGQAGMESVESW
jgi:hypothetical protein